MAEPPIATPGRLHSLPTWQLAQANARAHALLSAALGELGSRGHHYRLLAALKEIGPTSQARIGRAVALDRSDVALGLDGLERRGLVGREPDPLDRRRNQVVLTSAGERFLSELDTVMQRVQEQFLAPLTATERATLVELLQRLAGTGR